MQSAALRRTLSRPATFPALTFSMPSFLMRSGSIPCWALFPPWRRRLWMARPMRSASPSRRRCWDRAPHSVWPVRADRAVPELVRRRRPRRGGREGRRHPHRRHQQSYSAPVDASPRRACRRGAARSRLFRGRAKVRRRGWNSARKLRLRRLDRAHRDPGRGVRRALRDGRHAWLGRPVDGAEPRPRATGELLRPPDQNPDHGGASARRVREDRRI